MNTLIKSLAAGLILSTLASCALFKGPQIDMTLVQQANIINLKHTEPTVIAGGQPTMEQLAIVANAGIKHIINLRPASEQDWDEGVYVRSLKMEYHNIPVAGIDDVTSDNAKSLAQLLKSVGNEPVLVHCSSGNRVGALIALGEYDHNGHNTESSIAEGRRWGLTGLEEGVRAKILWK